MRIVGLDVPDVVPGELVNGLLDLNQAVGLTHGQRGEVGVSSGAVPVALFSKTVISLVVVMSLKYEGGSHWKQGMIQLDKLTIEA